MIGNLNLLRSLNKHKLVGDANDLLSWKWSKDRQLSVKSYYERLNDRAILEIPTR